MPFHEHDCSQCIFLGSEEISGSFYDYYFCDQLPSFPTVIARFGPDADYFSGLHTAKVLENIEPDNPLVKALLLARQKNLVK